MAFKIADSTAYLLGKLEKVIGKKKLDISEIIGISSASYYRMRSGKKNIGSDMVELAWTVIWEECPEILMEYCLRTLFEANGNLFCNIIGQLLSTDQLMQIVERKEEESRRYELVLSGNRGIHR